MQLKLGRQLIEVTEVITKQQKRIAGELLSGHAGKGIVERLDDALYLLFWCRVETVTLRVSQKLKTVLKVITRPGLLLGCVNLSGDFSQFTLVTEFGFEVARGSEQ